MKLLNSSFVCTKLALCYCVDLLLVMGQPQQRVAVGSGANPVAQKTEKRSLQHLNPISSSLVFEASGLVVHCLFVILPADTASPCFPSSLSSIVRFRALSLFILASVNFKLIYSALCFLKRLFILTVVSNLLRETNITLLSCSASSWH